MTQSGSSSVRVGLRLGAEETKGSAQVFSRLQQSLAGLGRESAMVDETLQQQSRTGEALQAGLSELREVFSTAAATLKSELGAALQDSGAAAMEATTTLKEELGAALQDSGAAAMEAATTLKEELGAALQDSGAAAMEATTELGKTAETITTDVVPAVTAFSDAANSKLAKALREVAKEAKSASAPVGGLTGVAQGLAAQGFAHLAGVALNTLVPGLGLVNVALKTLQPVLTAVSSTVVKVTVAAWQDLSNIVGPPLQRRLQSLRQSLDGTGATARRLAKSAFAALARSAAAVLGLALVGLAKTLDATLGKALRAVGGIISRVTRPAFEAFGRVVSRTLRPAFEAFGRVVSRTLRPALEAVSPVTRALGVVFDKVLAPPLRLLGRLAVSAARALNQWTGVIDAVAGALVRLGKEFVRITTIADRFQVVFRGVGRAAAAVARGRFGELGGILSDTRMELEQTASSAKASFREWAESVESFNRRLKGLDQADQVIDQVGDAAAGTARQLDLLGGQATESSAQLDGVETAARNSHLTFDQYAQAQRNVTRQLDLLGTEAAAAAPQVKELADRIGETGVRAKGVISSGTGRLAQHIRDMSKGSQAAAGSVKGLASAFGVLQSAFPILSIGVIVDRIRGLVTEAGQLNLQLVRLRDQSGISATTLDTFARSARQLGYDMGEVEGFVETFVERVQEAQEGTGEGSEVLKILNIDIRDLSGNLRSTEDVMLDYARTVSRITDQTEAAAFNTRLLGSDGFRLGSAFAEIAAAAGETDHDLEAMLERTASLNAAWNELQGVTLQNARALGDQLAPAAESVLDVLTKLGQTSAFLGQLWFGSSEAATDAARAVLGYGEALEATSDGLVTFRHRLNIVDELKAQEKAIADAQAANLKAVEQSLKAQAAAQQQFTSQITALLEEEIAARQNVGKISATEAATLTRAYGNVIRAGERREKALRDLVEVEVHGGTVTKELAAAYDTADRELKTLVEQTQKATDRVLGKVEADTEAQRIQQAQTRGLGEYYAELVKVVTVEGDRVKRYEADLVIQQQAVEVLRRRTKAHRELGRATADQNNAILDAYTDQLVAERQLEEVFRQAAHERALEGQVSERTIAARVEAEGQLYEATRRTNSLITVIRTNLTGLATDHRAAAIAAQAQVNVVEDWVELYQRQNNALTDAEKLQRDIANAIDQVTKNLAEGEELSEQNRQIIVDTVTESHNLRKAHAASIAPLKAQNKELTEIERRNEKIRKSVQEIGGLLVDLSDLIGGADPKGLPKAIREFDTAFEAAFGRVGVYGDNTLSDLSDLIGGPQAGSLVQRLLRLGPAGELAFAEGFGANGALRHLENLRGGIEGIADIISGDDPRSLTFAMGEFGSVANTTFEALGSYANPIVHDIGERLGGNVDGSLVTQLREGFTPETERTWVTFEQLAARAVGNTKRQISDLERTIRDGLQNAISGLIRGTVSWGQALADIGNRILTNIINKFAELATNSIFNLFTGGKGGGLGSLIGGLGGGGGGLGGAITGGLGKVGSAVGKALGIGGGAAGAITGGALAAGAGGVGLAGAAPIAGGGFLTGGAGGAGAAGAGLAVGNLGIGSGAAAIGAGGAAGAGAAGAGAAGAGAGLLAAAGPLALGAGIFFGLRSLFGGGGPSQRDLAYGRVADIVREAAADGQRGLGRELTSKERSDLGFFVQNSRREGSAKSAFELTSLGRKSVPDFRYYDDGPDARTARSIIGRTTPEAMKFLQARERAFRGGYDWSRFIRNRERLQELYDDALDAGIRRRLSVFSDAELKQIGLQNGGIIPRTRGGQLALVGEGRFNEAVVPLPNGRAIPVEVRGGGQHQQTLVLNLTVTPPAGGEPATLRTEIPLSSRQREQVLDVILEQQQPGGILVAA